MRCKGTTFNWIDKAFGVFFLKRWQKKSFFFGLLVKELYLCDMEDKIHYDLQLILAILGGKVSDALSRKLSRNFEAYDVDLTPDAWTVLLQLWRKDGMMQQELCHATSRDKPAMTRLINQMEQQGLVRRVVSKDDRRVNHICLTQLARDIEGKARFVGYKTLKEALRGLSTEELKTAQNVLKRVFINSKD